MLLWNGRPFASFTSVLGFRVRGLDNRYRRNGIGAPFVATLEPDASSATQIARVPARLVVPATAFLRIDDVRAQLARGRFVATLEIFDDDDDTDVVTIGGERVPIEFERSSSLAYMLEGSPIYDFGIQGFRLGDYLPTGQRDQLVLLRPHRRDRIPLVLVHGTFSSPATWAQLVNELDNDPEIMRRYEIWLFLYNSGNPIGYSAGVLAETLTRVVAELDPSGTDAALRNMVITGHSQGGLLTKLMVVDSGTVFWDQIARRPIDEVQLDESSRALLQQSLFFEPLPFVTRVVFMATPHRGSFLSDFRVVSWLSRLVKLPASLAKLSFDLLTLGSDEFLLSSLNRLPTSLDNMASNNRFLQALAETPIAPGVESHSIIAVRQAGKPETGDDGVVRFRSARLEGVASELVVRSGHSVQERQEAIQELRRILLLHAETGRSATQDPTPTAP
jgi:pimeloyl-ACP methyl ester carboxylesterase